MTPAAEPRSEKKKGAILTHLRIPPSDRQTDKQGGRKGGREGGKAGKEEFFRSDSVLSYALHPRWLETARFRVFRPG